jgi:hypothetical protein
MKCTYHPNVETSLSCSKCGKPICPKCMIQTPVGARCPDCARLYKLPTYQISTQYYLRAIGVGLGLAIGFGLLWGVIANLVYLLYLGFLLAAGFGYAIGELISLSVNRKRGVKLAIIAGISVGVSYIISLLPYPLLFFLNPFGLLALALGIYIAVTRVR